MGNHLRDRLHRFWEVNGDSGFDNVVPCLVFCLGPAIFCHMAVKVRLFTSFLLIFRLVEVFFHVLNRS